MEELRRKVQHLHNIFDLISFLVHILFYLYWVDASAIYYLDPLTYFRQHLHVKHACLLYWAYQAAAQCYNLIHRQIIAQRIEFSCYKIFMCIDFLTQL